jgi:iron-sulfur cluster assembly protein
MNLLNTGDVTILVFKQNTASKHYRPKTVTEMIYVAESAKQRIVSIREQKGYSDDYFVRVGVTSGGCSGLTYNLEFSNELKPDDQVFEDNGEKVVTDLGSFLYLFNTTLEFTGGLNGQGFYFNNPNASRTCACGESFSV